MEIVLCSYGVCFKYADSFCRNCAQQYCQEHILLHTLKGGKMCTSFLTPKEEIAWQLADEADR